MRSVEGWESKVGGVGKLRSWVIRSGLTLGSRMLREGWVGRVDIGGEMRGVHKEERQSNCCNRNGRLGFK